MRCFTKIAHIHKGFLFLLLLTFFKQTYITGYSFYMLLFIDLHRFLLIKNIHTFVIPLWLFLLLFSCVGKAVNNNCLKASIKFSKHSVHNQHEQLVCPCFCKLYDLRIDVNTVSILIVRNSYMFFPNQIC